MKFYTLLQLPAQYYIRILLGKTSTIKKIYGSIVWLALLAIQLYIRIWLHKTSTYYLKFLLAFLTSQHNNILGFDLVKQILFWIFFLLCCLQNNTLGFDLSKQVLFKFYGSLWYSLKFLACYTRLNYLKFLGLLCLLTQ